MDDVPNCRRGEIMDPMPDGYDNWKLASPEEYVDQDKIDTLEGMLPPCPFCSGKPFFEDSIDGWFVSCQCGARMPGQDAKESASKWMIRPTPNLEISRVRSVSREHWTGW